MDTNESPAQLKPMGWAESVVLFGVPGLVLVLTTAWMNPMLVQSGIPLIWSFSAALYLPLLALLIASVIAYRLEGHPRTWNTFAERMRLKPLRARDWWWVIGAIIVALIGEQFLEPTTHWLASQPGFIPPPGLPDLLDPFQEMTLPPVEFMGTPLAGNGWVAGLYAACLFSNIFGEELWWRGYILPRQEISFGRWAWLVNAVLWVVLFHAAMRWIYIAIIPTGLLTPLLAQRTQSTWAGIAIHGVGNLMFLILIIMGIMA